VVPWPPGEFKSGRLLRGPRTQESLEPLLTALMGRAHVQVVDKEFFLVTRVVDLFLSEPSYAAGTSLSRQLRPAALTLDRAGRRCGADWDAFLAAFADLVRTKKGRLPGRRVLDAFFRARDVLVDVLDPDAAAVLAGLTRTRTRAVLSRIAHDDPALPPPLEPLLPALAETVLFWSAGHRQVLVVHDEQSALTARRLRRLQDVLARAPGWVGLRCGPDAPAGGPDAPAGGQVSPLAGLVTVDSRDDPRVQVADILAGAARRSPDIAGDALLSPFLSPTSLRDPDRRVPEPGTVPVAGSEDGSAARPGDPPPRATPRASAG
jgi:hypothetical protein